MRIADQTNVCPLRISDAVFRQINSRSIESFLLDTDLNLYGSELRLDFVARLRDEKRFDSADALVAQIRTDVARARDLLTMYF